MALKIIKKSEPIKVNNLITVIYGQPGIGKTTLAFSSKNPLTLDFDLGIQRAKNRKDAITLNSWVDVMNITQEDAADYDTIVIDTVGRMLEVLAQYIMKTQPKTGYGGNLSLQGYGVLKSNFSAFIAKLRSFNKDIVIIAHGKEDKNGDQSIVRPEAVGSAKDLILQIGDLMGYVFIENNKRVIDFNSTDSYLGKNSPATPKQIIPDCTLNNHFLEDLLCLAKDSLNKKSEEQIQREKEFQMLLDDVDAMETVEDANILVNIAKKEIALKPILHKKATELGFAFDVKMGIYVKIDAEEITK